MQVTATDSTLLARLGVALGLVLATSCSKQEVDVGEDVLQGGECDLHGSAEDPEARVCAEGLVCEPLAGRESYVCGPPVLIRGQIFDALEGFPLAGAYVTALDHTGAPQSDVAVTDITGSYELAVSALRTADGELLDDAIYTLQVFAADYQPFPYGVRPALPINTAEAFVETDTIVDDETEEAREVKYLVVENPTTSVAMLLLPEAERGGATIFGAVGGEFPGGTLVVAEGGAEPAPYGIADLSGKYVIFNVQPGSVSVVGYRYGLELESATVAVSGGQYDDVDLVAIAEGEPNLGRVEGTISIVNAPGGSATSVVLVPTSVFNPVFELGPVPFGLREPEPGEPFNVTSGYTIEGVPAGTYKVLAAFENDLLVRDPDFSIGGTDLQEVTVGRGEVVGVDENFKITEALEIFSPGAEVPEHVAGAPTFIFADDSSENFYYLTVYDALGRLTWEDPMVPRVTGSPTVEVPYGGEALLPGMYYQFRVTSWKDGNPEPSPISRTEDLRGVFIAD
ncbi:MAG: hypothetical protein R3A51_01825 [Nannocystaceae bacterium]